MHIEKAAAAITKTHILSSKFLKRDVITDLYFPPDKIILEGISLLLINDGQDLISMNYRDILDELYKEEKISPVLSVGIHCGEDRRNEYGTANILSYRGEGAKAALYTRFIFEELLPFIKNKYHITTFKEKSFCGFSLGGLSALDIVWNHAKEFSKVGVFSGSFWWRSLSKDDPLFDENDHLIMRRQIQKDGYYPWLKFFFEAGAMDEDEDRNSNGIIDSIDDTLSLIDELVNKGYNPRTDIRYLELKDGHHDVATWSRAFPEFLKWGWRRRGMSKQDH